MRLVQYETEDGKKYQSWIKDDMFVSEAEKGLPYNPPDVSRLPWADIECELHNLLLDRGLITLKDVDNNSGMLGNTILKIIQPRLVALYKENPGYKKSPNGKVIANNKEA